MYASIEQLNRDTQHSGKLKKVYAAERIFQGDITDYEGSSLFMRGKDAKVITSVEAKPETGSYQVYRTGGISHGDNYWGHLFGHAYEVTPNKEDTYEKLTTDGGVTLKEVLVSSANTVTFKIPNVENREILQYAFSGLLDATGDIPIGNQPSKEIENKRFFVTIEGKDDEGKVNRLVYSNAKIKITSLSDSVESFRGLAVEITPELDTFTTLTGNVGYYLAKEDASS